MLIEITRKCNEMCTHCMVDALPNGAHMNSQVFTKAIQFAIDMGIQIVNISGGDPFLHPDCFKYFRYLLDQIKGRHMGIGIQSNGWWIDDPKMSERIKKLLDNEQLILMQISTSKQFYPNYEWTMERMYKFEQFHPKVKFTANWQGVDSKLQYMGRAKNIMSEDEIQGVPNCLNWHSYALALKHSNRLVGNPIKCLAHFATMREKTCIPYIDINGNIKLGEGISCKPIGNVTKMFNKDKFAKELLDEILSFQPCNNCKAMKNLTEAQRDSLNSERLLLGIEPFKN